MSTPYYHDGDIFCEDHAPEGATPGFFAETDAPEHCSVCQAPLDTSLTIEGLAYAREAVLDELARGRGEYLKVHPNYRGTYYEGEPHFHIVRDWAREHGLTHDPLVERAIAWMEYQEAKGKEPDTLEARA